MESQKKEHQMDKIKGWLKNPYHMLLILIVLSAFLLRLYFLIETKDQALWWDESEYMGLANHFAKDTFFSYNPQRPPLFQLIASWFIGAGGGEVAIRFLLVVIPSTILVLLIFFLGKEMFDEKIGIIAAAIAAVSWTFLFWSARVQPDFLSLCFQVGAIWAAWKYWKSNKSVLMVIAGVCAALALMFKVSGLLIPLVLAIFILVKERLEAFKNKGNYYFLGAYIIALLPYFVWSWMQFKTPFGFKSQYSSAFEVNLPFGWYNLKYFYNLTEGVLFVLFIIGIIAYLSFLLYGDVLVKEKKKCLDPKLFSVLLLIVVSAFYIFYIRNTEDRWVLLWMPFLGYIIGKGALSIRNIIEKFGEKIISKKVILKVVAGIVIIGLIGIGGYAQFIHGKGLIDNKKDTYWQLKDAGIWVRENSNKDDVLMSQAFPQMMYYTERKVASFDMTVEKIEEQIQELKPKYLQVSVFEKQPDAVFEWMEKNRHRLKAVRGYFADEQKQKPILIMYEVIYE